jgi:predicted GNAT superfamily acetyltransferase
MPAVNATVLNPQAGSWAAEVDALWAELGHPQNPTLFPDYFVKTTFPKLGGRLVRLATATGEGRGAALIFPRTISGDVRYVTLRLHAPPLDPAAVLAALAQQLAPDQLILYRPEDGRTFPAGAYTAGPYSIGAPAAHEVAAIAGLQRAVWGDQPGAIYPTDLHSAEFAPGSSLVARSDGRVVGFLFGFTRFTPPEGVPFDDGLYLESQLLAIAPEQRRGGLAAMLKRAQAQEALARGVRLIHWTADPLQAANAGLNFATLRAVAGALRPNYYPFTNALNRVAASRLSIVWLPGSAYGRAGLAPHTRRRRELATVPGVVVLNDGPRPIADAAGAPIVAIEIPTDWTALQQHEPELALAWREATDAILGAVLGFRAGGYVVTDVAQAGERRYLLAEAFRPELLEG